MACIYVRKEVLYARMRSFSDVITQSATLTWLNVAWSGGQLHGTWIGLPSAPFIAPSQFPVPKDNG